MTGRARTSANDWHTRQRLEQERAAHVAAHGPGCELCGMVPKTRGLQWDHDHRTGAHRGWLCHRCNRALPVWVTVRWLLRAACYLGATWDDFRDEAPDPVRGDRGPGLVCVTCGQRVAVRPGP